MSLLTSLSGDANLRNINLPWPECLICACSNAKGIASQSLPTLFCSGLDGDVSCFVCL